MATHVHGGKGTFTVTLTTVLNNSAFDRYLTVHVSMAATDRQVTLEYFDGAAGKKLVDAENVPARTTRDFGPYFFANGHSLRGGASVAEGDWVIDEVRP